MEWPYGAYIKTVKNGGFCKELFSGNNIEAVLANFCCYDHDANGSEAVQKIKRVSQMLFDLVVLNFYFA